MEWSEVKKLMNMLIIEKINKPAIMLKKKEFLIDNFFE
jgi:hypothetical protein